MSNILQSITAKNVVDTEITADFETDVIQTGDGVNIVFTGRFAGRDYNKPLGNAIRKGYQARLKKARDEDEKLAVINEIVINLYPRYVIVGWNLLKDGKEIPYSKEDCRVVLETLLEANLYELNELMTFFSDPRTFSNEILTPEQGIEKGN